MKYFEGVIIVFVMICISAKGETEDVPYIRWTCDQNGLFVKITFERNFSGVVFTEGFYANPNCSTPNMPAPTTKEVTLLLPLLKCGNKLRYKSNVPLVRNRLVINYHPMMKTIYDYAINVSCKFTEKLPAELWDSRSQGPPKRKPYLSRIEMKLGDEIFGYRNAERLGVSYKLFIVLFVRDWGKNRNFSVRKCMAHNDRIINNRTTVVQISEANSCNPNFTNQFIVIKNSTMPEMLAIMQVKPFNVKVKTYIYITCGIDLCRRTCPRTCPGEESNRWTFVQTYTVNDRRLRKRSLSEPDTPSNSVRSLKTTNNLLRSTVKVLSDRLLKLKLLQKAPAEDTNFGKRSLSDNQSSESDDNSLANSTEVEVLEDQFITELVSTNFSNFEWRPYSDFNVSVGDESNTEESNSSFVSYCSGTDCDLEDIFDNFSITLTDKVVTVENTSVTDVTVLPSNESFTISINFGNKNKKYLNINKRLADCVPQIKFLAVTISLGIISGCFFLICIGFYLTLRKERKKHSLDSYLLYSMF